MTLGWLAGLSSKLTVMVLRINGMNDSACPGLRCAQENHCLLWNSRWIPWPGQTINKQSPVYRWGLLLSSSICSLWVSASSSLFNHSWHTNTFLGMQVQVTSCELQLLLILMWRLGSSGFLNQSPKLSLILDLSMLCSQVVCVQAYTYFSLTCLLRLEGYFVCSRH